MNKLYLDHIAGVLSVSVWQVEHCIELFQEGSTIPFISRYRKERTGNLDEIQVTQIKHYFNRFEELEKRKSTIRYGLLAITADGITQITVLVR